MKSKTTLLTAALLLGGSSAFALTGSVRSALFTGVSSAALAVSDEAEELAKQYDKAESAHKKAIREAEREARKELRKNHPMKEFWPKFEALAANNDGYALLWMAQNVKANKAIKKADRSKVLLPVFTALTEHHTGAEWFPEAMASLRTHAGLFEPDEVKKLVGTAIDKVEGEGRPDALFLGARTLFEIDREAATAYLDEIFEEHGDKHISTKARALLTSSKDVQEGKVAPDFLGETLDGFKFNVSDYRGKVVVLDFYGFW